MSFGSDIGREFDRVKEAKLNRAVRSAVVNLRSDLIEATPVGNPDNWKVPRAPKGYTGGELRASWEQPEQIGKYKWVIRNVAPHALVIDGGRREIPTKGGGNMWVGSEQLPSGFGVIVDATKKQLQRVFDK